MKNMKRLMGLVLAVMMLSALACAMSVSAAGGHKLTVSHYNQNDVFSNACVIFTKEYMGEKSLGQITADYKAEMGDKIAAVDSDWNDLHTDHKFKSYYAMVCQWNEDMNYYEVVKTAIVGGEAATLTCPDNGFVIAAHRDDDLDGDHNYPSTEFGVMNLGKRGGGGMVTSTKWDGFLGKPVYLYNIDLSKTGKGEGIEVSGTFDSKMSENGIKNGLVETYQDFSSKSYVMIGEEDAEATVSYYEPKNIVVSFTSIENLQAKMDNEDPLDYTTASWEALEAAFALHEIGDESMTSKDVKAWKEEIEAAFDGLVKFEEGGDNQGGGNVIDPADPSGDPGSLDNQGGKKGDGLSTGVLIAIIAGGVLLIGAVAFVLIAMSKSKGAKKEDAVEETAEESTDDADKAE